MKKLFKRLGITLLFSIGILICAVLFPSLSYAHQTDVGAVTILHQQALPARIHQTIEQAMLRVRQADIYDKDFRPNLCLDDGSWYPRLIHKIKGEAFAYGVAHNAVFACEINVSENYAIRNGRKKYLHEAFAHEFIHTYQWNKFGLRTMLIPFWKLEGYCEYIMTRNSKLAGLRPNVKLLLESEAKQLSDWDWIEYHDDFGTTPIYLKSRVYVQYLTEVENRSYEKIVADNISDAEVRKRMLAWYHTNQ